MQKYEKPSQEPPTYEDWKKFVRYDPESGELYWRLDRSAAVRAGMPAGTDHEGYKRLKLGKGKYLAHRVAYLLQTGAWPDGLLDHRNRVKSDNTWANLRPATLIENANNRSFRGDGKLAGVDYRGGKYRARIRVADKLITLGTFTDEKAAHACYVNAKASRPGANLERMTVVEEPMRQRISSTGEKNVYKNRAGFQVKIDKCYGTYSTLAEAVTVRNNVLEKVKL